MEHKRTVEVYKALADDIRLGIIRQVAAANGPVMSCDIVKSCARFTKMSQPAMSHHFGKLVDAGVLIEEKSGTQKRYTIHSEFMASVGVDVTKL